LHNVLLSFRQNKKPADTFGIGGLFKLMIALAVPGLRRHFCPMMMMVAVMEQASHSRVL